ncbi:dTDP-4-dehydrorhamnose 3,5-epimerase [Croceitalea dokdonensis DOKDO 023]|uniref:dTDP-4-dehydrorhamnose 3,5-epimerase n=1 Tax=Croceitalea dokdonensis DOKDO 023 TaxID=1300341 RepID=A0A0P7B003_9FLAO|nr:dTDP-4-dehydrorhamnose 3,5-epimerase [Croceitalea dokdonensis]KPM31208.1 dTDP-4-dehydrorhamnose 3,5-epimerase [Croceitalea dokdonensis DOKDO 023]
MEVKETEIVGCFVLKPKVFKDERGYFFESFNQESFEILTGAKPFFVQDNQSFSTRGVLRGLHYQKGKYAQAKLVRVLDGEVLDVAVDLREGSPSFGKVISHRLSAANNEQLFIPRGCAHGFVTLSDSATFFYKCDNFYNKASEGGVLYNDPTFNIDWLIPDAELIISEKDRELPVFDKAVFH